MSTVIPSEQDVLSAATRIVEAFGATSTQEYFSLFAPEASFIFHPEATRLDDRASYEQLWNSWLAEGWRVASCRSTNQLVQVFPGGAVFSHTVETSTNADSYVERETIVFRQEGDGSLTAIHEHLSTVPEESVTEANGLNA
ncbi:YybH family protein [Glutamicibacter halophytocola]|uniref:YybH family protein n=1 Tax=Glutamicibacter halophytocola TaxID=1933880 RepID=UPI0015C568E4|nr:nuclear transport factor 2 family protein [Glutamicibacter halophytocola]NQD42861.1 SnoaL-like domain-containing protein [Glutamicibacter halophytocola]